jgi:hypothetical protein
LKISGFCRGVHCRLNCFSDLSAGC